jgi:hypothetical protein
MSAWLAVALWFAVVAGLLGWWLHKLANWDSKKPDDEEPK